MLSLLGQIRIFYAMGRDGLLPAALSRCSERFHTPHIGTLVTELSAAVIAGFFPLDLLGELISIGTLMAFAIVCAGIIILRRRMPEVHRPFLTPVPLIPVLGVISCVILMVFLPISTWLRLAIWLALGLLIYFGYGRGHSKLSGER